MKNSEKCKVGEKFVLQYLKKKGYSNVKIDSKGIGYDIIAEKANKFYKIEVKTTHNLKGGIPDMHSTEFIEKKEGFFFVADFLFVVRLINKNKNKSNYESL